MYIQFSSISPNAIAILIDFICSLVLVSTSVIANVNVWTFFFFSNTSSLEKLNPVKNIQFLFLEIIPLRSTARLTM